MCMSSISNVIYHKFSHGVTFYTLNGKNVNVMLEYVIMVIIIDCTESKYSIIYKGEFLENKNAFENSHTMKV